MRKRTKKGAAVLELVACLPLFVLVLMLSIDACNMIFLKQALTASAYEAAREAIKPEGTTATARLLAEGVLDARSITGYTVTFSPDPVEGARPGENVRAIVSAPAANNSPVAASFRSSANIGAEIVMSKQ